MTLRDIGDMIADKRRLLGLRQSDLAAKAGLSRATVEALENGRAREIGFSKLTRLLAVLGMEFAVRPIGNHRPTLDELLAEDSDD